MNFTKFAQQIAANVATITTEPDRCFLVKMNRDELFEAYLAAFTPKDNPIYAERTEHDCSCCKGFIRNVGHLVRINEDGSLTTIWDTCHGDYAYVARELVDFVDSKPIESAALFPQRKFGCVENAGESKKTGQPTIFRHFHCELPATMVPHDLATTRGEIDTTIEMAARLLREVQLAAIDSVLELIAQGSLYRGAQWTSQLQALRSVVRDGTSNLAVWARKNPVLARIRNTSIGTLLVDLSEDRDLEEAVSAYERITAPENYRRPTELVTKASLAKARAKVEELGLIDSLPHRFARIQDISVRDVLYVDRAVKPEMKDAFSALETKVQENPKAFDKVQDISMEMFLADVLPVTQKLEVLVTPAHRNRFMSLLAPVNPDAPAVTRWTNNFTWAYANNLADGSMRKLVKKHGGAVDGDLRFSISWNDDGYNCNDMDAHALEAAGAHIYFRRKAGHNSGGCLDVDIQHPIKKEAVENITWPDRRHMPSGSYALWVDTYTNRGGRGPLRAEVEFDGVIHRFEYPGNGTYLRNIPIAKVTLKNGVFTIKPGPYAVDSSSTPGKETWGTQENSFVRVLSILPSPSHWATETKPAGHKHTFFMLKNCTNPEQPNSFFNEFLKPELTPHRKVLEALGRTLKVDPDPEQLSGLGFVPTSPADLVVRSHGATVRTLRIK